MSADAPSGPPRRSRRRLRNLLLDRRFQLRLAGYVVAPSLAVAAVLGAFLHVTTEALFREMNEAVDARSRAAATSRELATCTLNNELARRLDDEGFKAQLTARSNAIDEAFEVERQSVLRQRTLLVARQQATSGALIGALVLFVLAVTLGVIVISHRLVGPLFRLRRLASDVASGHLVPPQQGLRPRDELHDVYREFTAMVEALRGQCEADLAAVEALERGDAAALERLKQALAARLVRS